MPSPPLPHAVAAAAAEAAAAIDRQLGAEMPPQAMERQSGALADRIPQRDVECRHRHRRDAAAAIGCARPPQIEPDRLDRRRVLADDARHDGLLDAGGERPQDRPEHEEISHADDSARGFDVHHEDVAGVAEGMALEPRGLRPRDAQHRRADRFDGHVGHGRALTLRREGPSVCYGKLEAPMGRFAAATAPTSRES
jgi:hypothetical protein